MRLYPAIDVKNGQCVRLKKGLFNEVTVYSERPYEIAKGFEEAGAQFIHTVDLDGALKGHGVNAETIKKICSSVNIPVQMGGGIRTLENIQEVLDLGVYRVIIGTKAVENPDFIKAAIDRFGAEHIVVGVDAKDGLVAIEGWEKVSDKTALSLALAMKDIGVQTIVYTDISKDGMLAGPNVEQTKILSDKTGIDIIASGGMSCMDDLTHINDAGIHGAIIGKAIYEKRIDLKEAVNLFESGASYNKASAMPKADILFKDLKLDANGLIPVVVQDYVNSEVLMLAYMNEEAFNKEEIRHHVQLCDTATHKIFYDKLEFIYVEIAKFNKSLDELETLYDKWLYALKNLYKLTQRPKALCDKVFDRLFEEAEIAKFTPQEQREYEASKMAYRDIKNSIDTAKREGKEEGLAEGMKKGMEKRSLEIARKMLANGMDAATVMEITGLSESQLQQLKG